MAKQRAPRVIIFLIVLILALSACRRQEDEATPLPADVDTESTSEVLVPTKTPQPPAEVEPEIEVGPTYDWPPQLVYSAPVRGEEVKLDGAITLRFDQPMDKASVEEAIHVNPMGKLTMVDGTLEWPRTDTVVFTPKSQLQREQIYEVQISETARSHSGKPLLEPVNLQLATVGYLEVSQVIPEPNVDQVQTDGAITVMFNRPVVPLVSTGQQADLPQPLRFEPAVDGKGEWVSTSIYRFTPDESLAGATQYRTIVSAGLEDVTGGVLAQDYSWRFNTQSPSVVSTIPENGATGIAPTGPITVTFNMPMDTTSAEAAISLQPGAPLEFTWSDQDRVVTARPRTQLELETPYLLTISDSALSANGRATLDHDTDLSFSTVPLPMVLNTRPDDGDLAGRHQRGVTIRFNAPMEPATLEDKVSIQPNPEKTDYYFNQYDNSLHIGFDIERNTDYEVTVPGTAADPYGNTIGADYSWRFRTEGYDPLVSMNLPGQVSQLSTSHPSGVDVIYRNVSRIDASLYDTGLPVETLVTSRVHDYLPPGEAQRNWSIPLEAAHDVADVYTLDLAEGGVLPTGVYFLEVDAPEIRQEHSYYQNQRNLIIVADTNLIVKEMFDQVYVWATKLADGQPAAGLNLTLFDNSGSHLGTAVTDGNGFANFDYQPAEDYLSGVLVVSNGPGEAGFGVSSSNWNEGVTPWRFGLNTAWSDEADQYVYLHTDRPIYRPGDTVHYRGIVRNTNYGRYPLPSVDGITVQLEFVTDYEPVNYEFKANLDENGEFTGEYLIPEDAQLGTYRLYSQEDNIETNRTFTVAEYRKPEFQVVATPSQDEVLRGEPVEVTVEASYFFGGPATDLPVSWSVSESDYWLPWDGKYYSFGDSSDFFHEAGSPFDFGLGGAFGEYITGGEGRTDGEGMLVIELPADLLDDLGPGSRKITVEASVLDISEFPISTHTDVIFHDADIYVGVVPADNIGTAGTSTEVDLLTVDWDGQTVPDRDVEVVFYQREWLPIRDQSFPGRYIQWEAVDTEVDRVQSTTDNLGKARVEFVPGEGGTYLAVATVTDDGGRSQSSSTSIWVSDENYIGWRNDPREKRMDLVVDKQEYRPGDTARILVQSPFEGPVNAWLTIERGGLLEQRLITLQTNSDILEIPITAELAPNVFVAVHAVKGVDDSNPFADMRLGIAELVVSPEQLALNLSLTPQSELFQPGDTAIYDILVTDYQGNPIKANFSLALVDLSVLTLKPDNAPNILQAFYERQPIRSQTGAGLIVSGEGLEIELPVEQLGLGGGGGGGLEAAAPPALQDEDDVRRDFPDTAYWEPKVSTDAAGRAIIEIPLPDSLTTWRLSSKAVSEYASSNETLVGQAEVDVISTLPLLIRPVTPRFFTVGDFLQLGAVVHNNTGSPLDATVTLEADGLTLEGPAEQTVLVPSGGREIVRWPVLVDDVLFADITFRVEAGEYKDATKPSFGIPPDQLIPVVRYTGEDVVGTSGVLEEAGRRVEAILLPPDVDTRQGEVQVNLSPSLAAAMIEALDYVNDFEVWTACAHHLSYRLLSNSATLIAVQGLGLVEQDLTTELERVVAADVERLEDLQKSTGGWTWCYSDKSDPYLSASVLLALAKAEQSGYPADGAVISRGTKYLNNQIEDVEELTNRSEVNRQAFFLYVLAELGEVAESDLDALFAEHRSLMDPYAKALLAMAYESTGGSPNQQALMADLNDSVVVSASGAHWEDVEPDWNNLASDIQGTAMIIDALARLDPDNPLAPGAVRWLMVARTAGHWPTLHENAWSVLALTDWMVATSELDADYGYQVAVNGEQLVSGQFDRDNITENEYAAVAVENLHLGEVNFLDFQRSEGDGRLYYTTYLDSFIKAENLEPVNRGFVVQRAYYDAACDPQEDECQPITEMEAGQQVRVELTIIVPNDQVFVVVEDPIPAGAEAIDPGLETSASGTGGTFQRVDQDYSCCFWGWWYFDRIEYRDDKVVFLSEFLPAGTYQYTYTLQTTIPGQYQVNPATARQEFFPEVFGRSDGFTFEIAE